MRPLLLLLTLLGASGAAAQGRLLDPGQSALGVAAGLVMPSAQPGSGAGVVAQLRRLGLEVAVVQPPPGWGYLCGEVCPPDAVPRPSVALAASWALVEQREGRPARIELTAEAGLERYGWEDVDGSEVRGGIAHRRGALGVAVSSRANAHRPVFLAPFASARAEVAETRRGAEGRAWLGGGLGWGLTFGPHAMLWLEARSEVDFWRARHRVTLGGGLVGTF